ncbi:glycosyltransferase [Catenuloplanes atrovinosus]|uniref:Glycosyltransferase involved in cell wall biosynthesis n=1 Tax=Catenuloplanes atrovinosus TaxID=137266 RepID=A0AAE3YR82_9ACTN|nr:glycosyltransferase [Catenuloplanes atrovinosus]MDR7277210.1 glycosyltransferase involved in cell wall biosynthesis [Catenuloplanes atrovinosus]
MSIVPSGDVPVFSEEDVLPLFENRLRPVLDVFAASYEVLAADDGSRDATPLVLEGMRHRWPRLRVARLRRDNGHPKALTAGPHRARGEYVASVDAGRQNPSETVATMLRLGHVSGRDVVPGIRADRSSDTRFKRWTGGLYHRLVRRLVGAGDFRLLDRRAVDALTGPREHLPVYRLIFTTLQGRTAYVVASGSEMAANR